MKKTPCIYRRHSSLFHSNILMEYQGEIDSKRRIHSQYNHTDSCKLARWTSKQCYQFMSARPWQHVLDFYSDAVHGHSSLFDLFPSLTNIVHGDTLIPEVYDRNELKNVSCGEKSESGRWARVTFKIVVSYHGGSFDGWQRQPGLNTVQGLVEKALGRFVDEKKAQLLKEKCKPLEGCVLVAGRTDKGVSALRQVSSFYTWRKDVKHCDIEDAINNAAPGKLGVVSISEVSRAFHPNFSAKWRRYLYIFPFSDQENGEQNCENEHNCEIFCSSENHGKEENEYGEHIGKENVENVVFVDDEPEGERKPITFTICRVNQLLRQLEGKLLSYKMFARDTPTSRNVGPPTECFVYHARAAEFRLPCSEGRRVMCIELVANRFLRKMVRVLVATSIREAAAGADKDALLKLMDATSRRATAPPAPAEGLCLVDVGYTEFDPKGCLIP
ncbi:hypothetical protein HS088_TW09G00986 [Tripterygium wilfordii]|uniref:tRNA pseudouridine synthase n=1 Tax=Tripterygium wilfordii TaxID=458696 RepID=A0A7J7D9F9_TRIWF|nr:tRNA pseudouridine synthase A [Tripterygium wilfordii]KAF5742924.1 hypothetical protein HS088_TW09G00986 [Tripterygium wilfordii]